MMLEAGRAVRQACQEFADRILDPKGGIVIPDTDEELNWHAFLAHSLDMQGFRADWFVGRQPNPDWPSFRTLRDRGIGVREMASLWAVPAIRDSLLRPREYGLRTVEDALQVLEGKGGSIGHNLAEAFREARMRKNIRTIRGYLSNSYALTPYGSSFRCYLQTAIHETIPGASFPPSDFMQPVTWMGRQTTLEGALTLRLERDFYGVGPEMAPYMLCDWMLGLWHCGETGYFESFKWDSRNIVFFQRYGQEIASKEDFLTWYRGEDFEYPPRVANEAIWLTLEPEGKAES